MKNNLGIWENENCLQCGYCCYDLPGNDRKTLLCRRQEIRDGKSYCSLHGPNKPEGCRKFFCSGFDLDELNEARNVAELLGTAPTNFTLHLLISAPQQSLLQVQDSH